MMGNGHFFVEWKEEFVSQERGHRVVHYFLKDSAGESVLAVIGTERSVRHMFYVVAEEFVSVYGTKNSIHTGFKWRSRREVVDWLTSMLSKQQLLGDRSNSPKHDLAQALDSPEYLINEFGAQQLQGRPLRNLGGHNSDIVWSGVAWTCGKQLKHYPAFCRNGTKIAIQSFVFVMAKGENHYLAYLEDMYEDKRAKKKVKVRWFHRNQEVKGVVLRNAHPKEVFITPYSQVISAECVDGPATVLTREHYEECFIAFPHASSNRIHMCYRQFRSNKMKPFDLRKLRGYFDQPIVSCLNSKSFPGLDSMHHAQTAEEDEEGDEEVDELSPGENAKLGFKRARSGKRCEPFESNYSGIGISDRQLNFEHSYLQIRNGIQVKKLPPLNHVVRHCWRVPLLKVDEKIELLCQDSGIRGCWFRCTILQVSRKQMKVQYDDLQDEDEYGNLEEWIPAFKLAAPDKFGMRCSGRPAVRPAPSLNEPMDLIVEVGCAVDAWWSDGWWEGVVTETKGDDVQVYFPGENFFLNIHKKDLRISRDWMGDKWIGIRKKPDITSAISANVSPDTKVITAQEIKSGAVALSSIEAPSGRKVDIIEEKKPDMATTSSDSLMEDVQYSDGGKALLLNNDLNGDGGNDVDVSHEKTDEVNDNDEGEVGGNDNENGDNCDIEMCENSELVRMCI